MTAKQTKRTPKQDNVSTRNWENGRLKLAYWIFRHHLNGNEIERLETLFLKASERIEGKYQIEKLRLSKPT